jgi:DNA-binding NarL/FixJ family response regulator
MSNSDPRCVLLADRHTGLTEGVRGLLESVFPVVVMVADDTSMLETARRIGPVLAVVDISLARTEIARWLVGLRTSCPDVKVILLSVHDEPSVCRSAMASGANGFVVKRDISTDLLPAIDAVLAGQCYISRGMRAQPSAVAGVELPTKPDGSLA